MNKETIEKYTITDKQLIRDMLNFPKSMPDSFILPLKPIGMSTYKGDKLINDWSSDAYFEIGKEYPIYNYGGVQFAIGNDGIGRKLHPNAWGKIK